MKQAAISGWLRLSDSLFHNVTNSSSLIEQEPILLQSDENGDQNLKSASITLVAVLAVLLHAYISHSKKAGVSAWCALSGLVMSAVIVPIVGTIFLLLACYRQCVITLLKLKCKKGTFAGLMQGNDAFWAVEDDASRSIINILALADFSFIVEASRKGDEPLNTVQELIEERLLVNPSRFPKLLCYRRQAMGYFFWERQASVDVQDHVRWMDYPEDQPEKQVSEKLLKSFVSSQMNAPLPADHASGWEILISRYPLKADHKSDPLDRMETGKRVDKYPVLFRVHHSLGDGVALIRLLLDALADPCSRTPSRTPSPMQLDPSPISNHYFRSSTDDLYKSNILNIPEQDFKMKKSSSFNFDERQNNELVKSISPSTSLKDCVRFACRKFINFLDEANEINRLQCQTQSLQNINILINDQPSDEYFCSIDETNGKQVCSPIRPNSLFVSRKDRRKFESFFVEKDHDEYQSGVFQTVWNKLKALKSVMYHLSVLALLPATVMSQSVNRINDENALHGPQLSGYKVVGWYLEDEDSEDNTLMSKIKRIRAKTGTHFSDVLLTALSTSLEDIFRRLNEVPDDITLVIPARIGRPDEGETSAKVATADFYTNNLKATVTKLYMDRNAKRNHSVIYEDSKTKLDNKFSVALLSLPVATETPTNEQLFGKLMRVQKRTGVLRKSADYIVNYWILRVIATLFPVSVLREVTKSTQSSMVVSNMPGPQKLAKLAGQTLHNIVFWVPNRDTTGLGLSILSYGGRLQLGIIADRALIPCSEDAQLVVDGIVDAINKMDQISSS